MVAAYSTGRLTTQVDWLDLSVDGRLALSLHSSRMMEWTLAMAFAMITAL